jgi:hypothetical protein
MVTVAKKVIKYYCFLTKNKFMSAYFFVINNFAQGLFQIKRLVIIVQVEF